MFINVCSGADYFVSVQGSDENPGTIGSPFLTIQKAADIVEGGETEFLYQSKRFQPKRGQFLIWPAGFTHVHRGNPPLSGEKYISTSWLENINA